MMSVSNLGKRTAHTKQGKPKNLYKFHSFNSQFYIHRRNKVTVALERNQIKKINKMVDVAFDMVKAKFNRANPSISLVKNRGLTSEYY